MSRTRNNTQLAVMLMTAVAIVEGCGREVTGPTDATVSVVVTPASYTFTVLGETAQLTAEARDASGKPIPGKTFTWASSAPHILDVDPESGLLTAVSTGTAMVAAMVDGVSGQTAFRVASENSSQEPDIPGALVIVEDNGMELQSTPEELDKGYYRYSTAGAVAEDVAVGTYLISMDGDEIAYLRRVVWVDDNPDLRGFGTVPGYLPEIVRGGDYRFTTSESFIPAGGPAAVATSAEPLGDTDLPLTIDLCNLAAVDWLPTAIQEAQICNRGEDFKYDKIVGSFLFRITGNIDQLVLELHHTISPAVNFLLRVDKGGVVGGSPAQFSPCTAVPAACGFTGWCLVGSQVVVSLFPFRTVTCVQTKPLVLPKIIPPSLQALEALLGATSQNSYSLTIGGKGSISIDIPIPPAAIGKEFDFADSIITGKFIGGLFVHLEAGVTGVTMTIADTIGVAHQLKTLYDGQWRPPVSPLGPLVSQPSITFDTPPDTITVKVAFRPLLEIEAALTPFRPLGVDLLNKLQVKAELGLHFDLPFIEYTHARPPLKNWHGDLDAGIAYAFNGAISGILTKLTGPLKFNFANELRFNLVDFYGLGDVVLQDMSSADVFDAGGYSVRLQRARPNEMPSYGGILETSVSELGAAVRFSELLNEFPSSCKLWQKGAPYLPFTPTLVNCDLVAEDHTLEVYNIPDGCWVEGANPRAVALRPDETVTDTVRVACGDDTVGRIDVTVVTASGTPDPDGYLVTVGSLKPARVSPNSTTTLGGVSVGEVEVQLSDLAPHCQVTGPANQTVTVPAGGMVAVSYEIQCQTIANPGGIRVNTLTVGEDVDSDGYHVMMDGFDVGAIAPDGEMVFASIAPGVHELTLTGVADNCVIEGTAPIRVDVPGGGEALVSFQVTCEAAKGEVTVFTHTNGRNLPDTPYGLTVGGLDVEIAANSSISISELAAGETVVSLSRVPLNCTAPGLNYQTVLVEPNVTTEAYFELRCRNKSERVQHAVAGEIIILQVLDPGTEKTTESGVIHTKDQILEVAMNGSITGTGRLVRDFRVRPNGRGSVRGTLTLLDGQWNGWAGPIEGRMDGRLRDHIQTASAEAWGDDELRNLEFRLDVVGSLEGPWTYDGMVAQNRCREWSRDKRRQSDHDRAARMESAPDGVSPQKSRTWDYCRSGR